MGDRESFAAVRAQQAGGTPSFDNICKLPTKIVSVLHTRIHSHPRFWRLTMECVSAEKHSIASTRRTSCDAASWAISANPVYSRSLELVGPEYVLCLRNDFLGSRSTWVESKHRIVQLDIESDEVVFARDGHKRAMFPPFHYASVAYIR